MNQAELGNKFSHDLVNRCELAHVSGRGWDFMRCQFGELADGSVIIELFHNYPYRTEYHHFRDLQEFLHNTEETIPQEFKAEFFDLLGGEEVEFNFFDGRRTSGDRYGTDILSTVSIKEIGGGWMIGDKYKCSFYDKEAFNRKIAEMLDKHQDILRRLTHERDRLTRLIDASITVEQLSGYLDS